MSDRAARWWLFAALASILPFPLLGPFDGFVPAVRYLILFSATGAVALVEGAAGPVLGILLLFALHAAAALLLAWALAWGAARALASLLPGTRRIAVWGAIVFMLACAIAFEPYETGFGRAPTANLFGVVS